MANAFAERIVARQKMEAAAVKVPRFTKPEQYINFMIEVIDLFDVRAVTDYAKKLDSEYGTELARAIKQVEAATRNLSDELLNLAKEIA